MNVTDQNLQEFKAKMNIYHSHKDADLKNKLESSYLFIKGKCGDFTLDTPNPGLELVYNRARYDYYDSLEYFDSQFMSMVMNFSLQNLPKNEEATEDGSTL